MERGTRAWGLWRVLGLVVLLGIWVFGASRPKAPNVQLKASFRGDTNPSGVGYEFYADKIFNDGLGEYRTTGDNSVSVWITPDLGELFFKIEHHADRMVNVVFPIASGECGLTPDTVGIDPSVPDEPVDFFRFKTYNSAAFAGPTVNLLTMDPWESAENPNTKELRLWTTVCTTERHYYLLNYNNPNLKSITGVVLVTAYRRAGEAQNYRWEIQPADGGYVYLIKQEGNGANQYHCYFGTHYMPFFLTLERVN